MTQNNRIWMIGTVTVMLVLVIAGWFLGAQPFIAAATTADQQTADVTAQNVAQAAEIVQLTTEMKQLPELKQDYKALQASIPGTSNTAEFIKGLDGLATAAGVQIVGFTVGDPLAYTIPASVAAAAAPAPSPSPSAAPTAAPPALVSTAPAVVTNPLITTDNFVGIQVVIDVSGQNANVLNFIKGLQTGTRLYLVTGITSTRDVAPAVGANPEGASAGDPDAVTTHVTGYIYVIKNEG